MKKIIDVNAHIENISCEVSMNNSVPVATVSFSNLSYGDITAIKFNAKGYNSFGDVVCINGKENFFLIIQDVFIKKNSESLEHTITLPSLEIRKVEIEESQICFSDGKVVSYEGKKEFEVELEVFDDNEQIKALHKLYNDKMIYKIKELEMGWMCSCGRYNDKDEEKCGYCDINKNILVYLCSEEGREKIINDYRLIIEDEEIKAKEANEKKKEERKKRRKKNIVIAVCTIIVISIFTYLGMLGQRTIYSSEEEMLDDIKGTYSYYYKGDVLRQIKIDEKKVNYIYKYTDGWESDITKLNPKQGTFKTFEKIIVTADGNLKIDGDIYEKGGSISYDDLFDDYSYSDYESGYSVLDITDLKLEGNSSYDVCTGKVKNTGEKTYYFIEVKGAFKDKSGNVLDTDWTYVVGSEGLEPGESSSFRLSVDRDYNIENCSVEVLDYSN